MGDVHPAVADVAGALTPVPGGVGPLTIAMLMKNTLTAASARGSGRSPSVDAVSHRWPSHVALSGGIATGEELRVDSRRFARARRASAFDLGVRAQVPSVLTT